MFSPIGSLSSHMMVNPRVSACFFIRSSMRTSPSMENVREMVSCEADCGEGAGVVMVVSQDDLESA